MSSKMKLSRSEFINVRGLRYHVRCWGDTEAPKIFMLHGLLDVSASYQFLVDELRGDWQVIAPDWRGFGLTQWAGRDSYWFPDYLADLDFLLEAFQPDAPVNLVGHSMGANVTCMYSGIRPDRVRRVAAAGCAGALQTLAW
jgi:pimeloyl-ACP methyl ester carboxylesterase